MKKIFLNGVFLTAIVLTFGITGFSQRVGGYKQISNKDEQAVAAANFAVVEAAKKDKDAKFSLSSINKVESQVVAGTNYRFCLIVNIDGADHDVKTVVFRNLKNEFSLTSWKTEPCSEHN